MNLAPSVLEMGVGPGPVATPRTDATTLLAEAARAGDRAALRRLLARISPGMLAAVRAILGPAHPAVEDVLQESLVGLVRALPGFRGESSIQTYAGRIAARTALTLRRQGRERRERDEILERGSESVAAGGVATPEDEALASKRRAQLRRLLDELPEAQAETLALRVVLDYSLEEVAAATGAPVNTVRSRLRLAREALRARIESDPELASLLTVMP